MPILHSRNYTDAAGDIHSHERDLVIRARLQKANGRTDNQVIWVGPPSGYSLSALSLDLMNEWLDKMAADPAPLSRIGPRLSHRRGAQELGLTLISEKPRRARLSRHDRAAVQVEAADLRQVGRLTMAVTDAKAIEREIARLHRSGSSICAANGGGLSSAPPRISRDLLVLALGYRLQEIERGGLTKSIRRKLQTMAKALRTTGQVCLTPNLSLKPGARLIREWRGRTHAVTVTEDGFEYGGASYSSLSTIAKKITGAHWSGPRLFGLRTGVERRQKRARGDVELAKTSQRSGKRMCAIYTRKSSEEGLDRPSTHSTPSAKPAPPMSSRRSTRAGGGATLYDDGGYSGGTTERPALKRLIADIDAARSTWSWFIRSIG